MTGKDLRLRLAREKVPYELLAKRIVKAGGVGGVDKWASKIRAYARWEETVLPAADEQAIRKGFGDAVTQTVSRAQKVDDWEVEDLRVLVGQATPVAALELLGIRAVKVVDRWELTAEARIDLDRARRQYWAREVASVLQRLNTDTDGLAALLKKKPKTVMAWLTGDVSPGYAEHVALRALKEAPPPVTPIVEVPSRVRRKPRLSVVESAPPPAAPAEPEAPKAPESLPAPDDTPSLMDSLRVVMETLSGVPPEVRRAWTVILTSTASDLTRLCGAVTNLRADVHVLRAEILELRAEQAKK